MTRIESQVRNDLINPKIIAYDHGQEVDHVIIAKKDEVQGIKQNIQNHNHDEEYIQLNSATQVINQITHEEIINFVNNYEFPRFTLEDNGDLYIEF